VKAFRPLKSVVVYQLDGTMPGNRRKDSMYVSINAVNT
jgi:hypothetical protein